MGNRPRHKSAKRRIGWLEALIGAVAGAIVGFIATQLMADLGIHILLPNPTSIAIADTNAVDLLDRGAHVIRRLDLGGSIAAACLDDIDGDHRPEVIVGNKEVGDAPGRVRVFSVNGRLRWQANMCSDTVMAALDSIHAGHSDCLRVLKLTTANVYGGTRKYVVALAVDPVWFASRVVILDPKTHRATADLWNPGQLKDVVLADLNGDDTLEVILTGLNNSLRHFFNLLPSQYAAMVSAYPPRTMIGQCPPSRIPGLPFAQALWHVIIPPVPDWYVVSKIEDYDGDGRNDVCIQAEGRRFYYINGRGQLIGAIIGDPWIEMHPNAPAPMPLTLVQTAQGWVIANLPAAPRP